MEFEEFKLAPSIIRALKELKYKTTSPIQAKTIPVILNGRDLIGCAKTGTGKTCAFAVPIINNIISSKIKNKNWVIRALVLAPTRELAMQIFNNFRLYTKYNRVRSCVVFGAVSYRPQIEALARGADILIATPGRLNDLIQKGYVNLSNIKFFVLDEADIMLDMGFFEDIKKIIKLIPTNRQTLMFSATMSKNIAKLANSILKNPVKAIISPPSTTIDLTDQSVYMIDQKDKIKFLIQLIESSNISSAIVFTRTKTKSDKVAKELIRNGIVASSIHSDKSQWDRLNLLNDFKNGNIKILVATDVVSRGIDIKNISHVINYDIPYNSETYVHRIGRTGRAGKAGVAITFCENFEINFLKVIEKAINKKIKIINKYNGSKNSNRTNNLNLKSINIYRHNFTDKKSNFDLSRNINKINEKFDITEKIFIKNKNKAKSFNEWFKNEHSFNSMKNKHKNSNNNLNNKKINDKIVDFALRKSIIKNKNHK